MRVVFAFALAALLGCMTQEPTGPSGTTDKTPILDQNLLAGATSSTNWPPEDAGYEPIQVFGTADSQVILRFNQAPARGEAPVALRISGSVRIYDASKIPVFDSLPFRTMPFSDQDSVELKASSFISLCDNAFDTCALSIEIQTDTLKGLLSPFLYSKKQKKFLVRPPSVDSGNSLLLSNPHYKFAGFPGAGLAKVLADSQESEKFYYYIPGSPYFWRHSLKDTLFVGPTFKGWLPLRFLKVSMKDGAKKEYSVEAYPVTLEIETINDSIHHFEQRRVYQLGPSIFHFEGQGGITLRGP